MKTHKKPIFPEAKKTLDVFGENIKLARLRRKLSMEQVAERAGISRSTLIKIEKGDEGVSMGSYFQVLFVLRLHEDFLVVAKDDLLGRKIQDAGLVTKQRAPKNNR
ncbi:MAG: XRE family transcriptional regulator [Bdellovibrionales bacterium GWA2_49_15]|nr:MAG: XRE family transcriptional regulator [Bdellovibrionales bacterium GWA2_49_15]HAZ12907.1 transcriptional regulator [Bdellovibrionales bacterium]